MERFDVGRVAVEDSQNVVTFDRRHSHPHELDRVVFLESSLHRKVLFVGAVFKRLDKFRPAVASDLHGGHHFRVVRTDCDDRIVRQFFEGLAGVG